MGWSPYRDSGGTSQIAKLKIKLENQRSQIAALHEKDKGGGNELSDYDYYGEEEGTFNTGHTALNRQNKTKKGKGHLRSWKLVTF